MSGQNDQGAVYLVEAALATAMVMAALYYVNSMAPAPSYNEADSLSALASDVLNVLEFRANSLEHPSLGFSLYSRARWNDSSDRLYADILRMIPPGTYCYVETPYGNTGHIPAPGAKVYVRPFVAAGDAGGMLDCKLVLWRI